MSAATQPKSSLRYWTQWIITNALFMGCIVAGTLYGIAGAGNVVTFVVAVQFLLSLVLAITLFASTIMAENTDTEKAQKLHDNASDIAGSTRAPAWLRIGTTLVELALMAWFGWFVTALLHALTHFCISIIRWSADDIAKTMQKRKEAA